LKVYYSHCQAIYGTKQESRDIDILVRMGFEIVNPSDQTHQDNVIEIKKQAELDRAKLPVDQPFEFGIASRMAMVYFLDLQKQCDVVAFRALPDGSIPAGVAKEIESAQKAGKPVIELPGFALRKVLSVESTRAYLAEVGQR
jgi:hypothetical protein